MPLTKLDDLGPIQRPRSPLTRTWNALDKGHLTVGFIGGSITDARPGHNWPEPVIAWFVDEFPDARIVVENAAIGATGSNLAVFRAESELIAPDCDLVFVEYAVNDGGTATEQRNRTREGLIRKLLADGGRDVVLVYTFNQPMYDDMITGVVPPSIAELETIAEHYGLSSVWMGLNALKEVAAGLMNWQEWLPDGLHPRHRGSLSYAQSVCTLLEADRQTHAGTPLASHREIPLPLNAKNWESGRLLPLTDVETNGPWSLQRWRHSPWLTHALHTNAFGSTATINFTGRGILIALSFGDQSANFRWRLDGDDWQDPGLSWPDWAGPRGWLRPCLSVDDLEPVEHCLELEVTHPGDGNLGSHFDLALVGIL